MSARFVLRQAPVDGNRRAIGQTAPPAPEAVTMPRQPITPSGTADGYAEGLRQGLADAQARIEKELETRWQAAQARLDDAAERQAAQLQQRLDTLDALHEALPERFVALERQAIELAFEALCRVCGPQPDRGGLLADLVRHSIDQLRNQALTNVRLQPDDHAAFAASPVGAALIDRYTEVRWLADPSVAPGGCRIETDHGQLDAGLLTQLDRLRELWSAAAHSSSPPEC